MGAMHTCHTQKKKKFRVCATAVLIMMNGSFALGNVYSNNAESNAVKASQSDKRELVYDRVYACKRIFLQQIAFLLA